jgi:hypothetical protein
MSITHAANPGVTPPPREKTTCTKRRPRRCGRYLRVESLPESVWELAAVRHPIMIVLLPLPVLETLSENPSFAA